MVPLACRDPVFHYNVATKSVVLTACLVLELLFGKDFWRESTTVFRCFRGSERRLCLGSILEKLQAMCAKVVCSHESDQVCGEVAAHVLLAAANE